MKKEDFFLKDEMSSTGIELPFYMYMRIEEMKRFIKYYNVESFEKAYNNEKT